MLFNRLNVAVILCITIFIAVTIIIYTNVNSYKVEPENSILRTTETLDSSYKENTSFASSTPTGITNISNNFASKSGDQPPLHPSSMNCSEKASSYYYKKSGSENVSTRKTILNTNESVFTSQTTKIRNITIEEIHSNFDRSSFKTENTEQYEIIVTRSTSDETDRTSTESNDLNTQEK